MRRRRETIKATLSKFLPASLCNLLGYSDHYIEGELGRAFKINGKILGATSCSKDIIAVCCADQTIKMIDMKTEKVMKTITDKRWPLSIEMFSRDKLWFGSFSVINIWVLKKR